MSAQRCLTWFTAVIVAAVAVVVMPPALPGRANAAPPCVSFTDPIVDCPPVSPTFDGRIWHAARIRLALSRSVGPVSEDLAAGLSVVGSTDLDPASPAWRELVLARFGAVAKRTAPYPPKFLEAVVDPGDERVGAWLTDIGLALADALGWLVAAEVDPGKADGYRGVAIERFGAVRALMVTPPEQ